MKRCLSIMSKLLEKDKLIRSMARYIAGTKRRYNKYLNSYWKKVSNSKVVEMILMDLRTKFQLYKQCPFCGSKFVRTGSFVTHLLRKHYNDLELILEAGGKNE